MCLGVPGQLVRWINRDPLFATAEVEFGGIRRACSMACVPDVDVGHYVIVHAGIAISRIDEEAARRTLADLASLDESPESASGGST
jgi:hydrogenase expression/formation protein HypC